MRLLVEHSPTLPLATVGITFRAGRADESEARAGLARVTAKMLRRGAGGPEAVEHELDRLGAELSEQVGLGSTTLSMDVLARSVPRAVELLAGLLATPCADPVELGRLVRQSKAALIRARDDDAVLCSRALRRHLFAGHPHERRVLGSIEGLAAITAADVEAFAQRFYTRDNAIVHICGDVSHAQAEAVAARLEEALRAGEPVPYPAGEPTPVAGRRLCIVDKKHRTQTQLAVGTLGSRADDPDHHALLVANAAFGGTFTSRLTRVIRGEHGWSYGASSELTTGRVREAFALWTAPAAEDASDCLAAELDLLEEWYEDGIHEEELEQCRGYLTRSHAFEIDTPHKRLGQQLERALLDLPADFHERYLEHIAAVTRDEANAAVRRRIKIGDLWIACVGDADALRDELSEVSGELVETVVDSVELP